MHLKMFKSTENVAIIEIEPSLHVDSLNCKMKKMTWRDLRKMTAKNHSCFSKDLIFPLNCTISEHFELDSIRATLLDISKAKRSTQNRNNPT